MSASETIASSISLAPSTFPSLGFNSTDTTTIENGKDGFYSFLCWYLFFLSCCVFPTIWLIRKRFLSDTSTIHCVHFDRDVETGSVMPRLEEVGDEQADDPNNVILWAGYNDDRYNIILTKIENEQAFLEYLEQYREVNHQKMLDYLGQCSMVVTPSSILRSSSEGDRLYIEEEKHEEEQEEGEKIRDLDCKKKKRPGGSHVSSNSRRWLRGGSESESQSLLSISSDCVLQILVKNNGGLSLQLPTINSSRTNDRSIEDDRSTNSRARRGTSLRNRNINRNMHLPLSENNERRKVDEIEDDEDDIAESGANNCQDDEAMSEGSAISAKIRPEAAASQISSRNVPISCAICLSKYKVKDEVTWSTNPECKHCFHKTCISQWLSKKDNSLCPCCRREFLCIDKLKEDGWIGDDSMKELKDRIRTLFQEPPSFVFSSPFQ